MTTDVPAQPAHAASARLDAACAKAVDLARDVLVAEVGEPRVGEHLRAIAAGERLVEHRFAAFQPGYVGWYWSVTVVRPPRAKHVTVCEIALLPDSEAVLAPSWVPWSQRLRPGDVGVGDLLPADADDERLMFTYEQDVAEPEEPESATDQVGDVRGLGRRRVLSPIGREQAASRWYESDAGPQAPLAKAAPGRCGTCGFYVPLSGSLGAMFGACGNIYAPDDGKVVSADHGCGAHSEAAVGAN